MPPICRTALALALAMSLAAATARAQSSGEPLLSAQRFRSGTDVVLIDVSVLDRTGRPVADLGPDDLSITVGGKPRPIRSMQYVAPVVDSRPPAISARERASSTNFGAASGRLLLIAVDETHLTLGRHQGVLRAAESLLGHLAPGDPVAVARLPDGGGVEFTTDRARVVEELRRITGRAPRTPAINARVYLSEALDFDGSARLEWPQALVRECGDEPTRAGYLVCVENMEIEAKDVLRDESLKSANVLQSLEQIVTSLEHVDAPVTVVLISEGLFVGRDASVTSRFSALETAGRVRLHVVKPHRDLVSIRDAVGPVSPVAEDAVLREGLERLALRLGGSVYPIAGTGQNAFDRIGASLSGYYLIGIDATDEDRTGRPRRIRISVKRRGLSVQSRPSFTLRSATARAVEPMARLLSSPVAVSGVPIRLAAYAAFESGTERVRLLVSAEVGELHHSDAPHQIGLIVLGEQGEVVATASAATPLVRLQRGGGLFATSVAIEPGDYSLRLGVITADGRAGSVHHPVRARLERVPGGFSRSDLIVAAEPGDGEQLRVLPSGIVEDDRVAAILQMAHTDAARLRAVDVHFEVMPSDGPAVLSAVDAETRLLGSGARHREYFGVLPLGGVPPGEYRVRARAGGEVFAERLFRLEPGDKLAPQRLTPLPHAVAGAFLSAGTVAPLIDALERQHAFSEAVREVATAARRGEFVVPPEAESRPIGDVALVTFVRGLGALRDGRIAVAQTLFAHVARVVPDFVGAVFYRGVAHALAGADRQAVAAWETVSDRAPQIIYPPLVDALLRIGDGARAAPLLDDEARWPGAESRLRRLAVLHSASGRYADAVSAARALVEAAPADKDALFLGLQLLFQAHLAQPLDDSARATFDTWARRSVQAGHPQAALVETWRRAVFAS